MKVALLRLKPPFQISILFYILLFIIVLVHLEVLPDSKNLLIITFSMAFLQFYLCSLGESKVLRGLRDIVFPTFSVILSFELVGHIVPYINSDIDHLLLELDYKILGFYPYLYLQSFTTPLLTEIMQLSYCVYYFLPFFLGFYLLLKGQSSDFYQFLFKILLCYYLSFIGYALFPALGPRYSIQSLFYVELKGLWLAEEIGSLLNSLEGIKRDAFPSGHVAISVLVHLLFLKYSRGIFVVLILPITLMILSTIYCRYHYFVDVLAGFFLAFVTLTFGRLYYNFWQSKYEAFLKSKLQGCNF